MNSAQRAIEAAVEMIRRMRFGAVGQTPASFGYRLGDDLVGAARRAPGTAISTDVLDPSVAPKAVAGAAGAGLSAGMIGLGMFGEEPAVTSGGEAELAATAPPLVVPVDDVVAPPPARKPPVARAVDEGRAAEIAQVADPVSAAPPSLPPADDIRAAVGRGSLYPQEAELVARERGLLNDARDLGMDDSPILPPGMRDAAAGNDMVGRFRFVHSPTGLRAVDTSAAPQEQAAEFRKWANEQPGSERQATYDPAGYAEWERKITEMRHRDYLADNAKYGSAEGPGWRDRLTPEQVAAREARRVAGHEDRLARFARKEAMKTDPMFADTRAKQDEQAADLARRQNNRRLLQQNPFLTLGDPGLNEWQQFVLSQNMLRGDQKVTDPNAVEAQQLNNIGDVIKRSLTAAAAGMQPQAVSDAQAAAAAAGATMKENELPVEDHAEIERQRGKGVIRGNTSAGRRLLQKISDAYVGNMYATTKEVDDAVAEAVRQGVPREDAEAFFAPRRRTMYQWATGS